MKCLGCKVEKLSKEFPSVTILDSCYHPPLHCFRCLIKVVEQQKKCPHPTCQAEVPGNCVRLKEFQATVNRLFAEYTSTSTVDYTTAALGASGGAKVISVVMMNGESISLSYNPSTTIHQIKLQIQKQLHHNVEKQRLIYNEVELKTYANSGQLATMGDYGVQPHSTVHLIIMLYAIPEHFNHVIFDLFWGYPYKGRDYLDASCLLFSGTSFIAVIDYGHTFYHGGVIRHSGDVMDDYNRKGHHTINVKLKEIPSNITHMFFTLSAWSSPNISKYPNPSLRFFEASNKNKQLCSDQMNHAAHSQAIVMCSVSRKTGVWKIDSLGTLSQGNAMNYDSLKATIRKLIQQGV
ncbi:uncharacterized protein LOC118414582 [Branchiostoma floridae]|uniref:Uncharacterized protein LOC118414582 n=1 Tax=Branchiostoma floridae TaxID=7739 RepID=A0A9J7L389_BRAFL|nr:uncharacterized protein LOC118414582 [Branchiostoma floridae]XP_035674621.1 uncharacterized protein LOC118414582 [Branchiostoma floridae]